LRVNTLPRRVLTGLAGVALGMVGVLGASLPAHATGGPEAADFDTCDGTQIRLTGVTDDDQYAIEVDGSQFWPGEGDDQPELGEDIIVFVPAGPGEIKVLYLEAPETWSEVLVATWESPPGCALLEDPGVTQPTCDTPGKIVVPPMPEQPDDDDPPDVIIIPPRDLADSSEGTELLATPDEVEETTDSDATPLEPIDDPRPTPSGPVLAFWLDGEMVEPESTHEVEPGSHVLTLEIRGIVLKTWVIEIVGPDCPDPDGDDEGGTEDDEDGGQGGELAKTGVPTGYVIGAGVALFAIGGSLYLLARRRRTTFTT
jgi:hypothetical protein